MKDDAFFEKNWAQCGKCGKTLGNVFYGHKDETEQNPTAICEDCSNKHTWFCCTNKIEHKNQINVFPPENLKLAIMRAIKCGAYTELDICKTYGLTEKRYEELKEKSKKMKNVIVNVATM